MNIIVKNIEKINYIVNELVWGPPMLVLILLIGLYFSVKLNLFQLLHIKHIFKKTIGSLRKNKNSKKDSKSISQFGALSTALAATIGTGSISGVATAITIGGAGAVFWMWVSAIFGMMTVFAENVLGIYYRKRGKDRSWKGGAMYYIEYGLHSKWLAVIYSIFCIFASFGMGNMVQSNSISTSLLETANVSPKISGIIICFITAIVIIGGLKRIGKVCEILVPVVSVIYIVATLIVIFSNASEIPKILKLIITEATGIGSVAGGIVGINVKRAVSMGVKRGVFSNEAGLGSSVLVHAEADVKEPAIQGMWGIVEVFIDTIVVCTLTAFVILTSGALENTNLDGAVLVIKSFENTLGGFSSGIMTFFIVIFAFATVLGWAYFGEKAVTYIFGKKSIPIYKIIFIAFLYIGSTLEMRLVWNLSDTFNGLMAIPNLIALFLLSPVVIKITKNYINRVFKHSKEKPLLSAFEINQK